MKRALPIVALALVLALVAAFAAFLFRYPNLGGGTAPAVRFQKVSLADLPGWQDDDLAGFRQALNTSCKPWPRRTNALAKAMAILCADVPVDEQMMNKNETIAELWLKLDQIDKKCIQQ